MKKHEIDRMVTKLEEQFFVKKRVTNHTYFQVFDNDTANHKLITRIKISHTPKDHHDKFIAKDLFLQPTELRSFVDCKLSDDDWKESLKQEGKWPS